MTAFDNAETLRSCYSSTFTLTCTCFVRVDAVRPSQQFASQVGNASWVDPILSIVDKIQWHNTLPPAIVRDSPRRGDTVCVIHAQTSIHVCLFGQLPLICHFDILIKLCRCTYGVLLKSSIFVEALSQTGSTLARMLTRWGNARSRENVRRSTCIPLHLLFGIFFIVFWYIFYSCKSIIGTISLVTA